MYLSLNTRGTARRAS